MKKFLLGTILVIGFVNAESKTESENAEKKNTSADSEIELSDVVREHTGKIEELMHRISILEKKLENISIENSSENKAELNSDEINKLIQGKTEKEVLAISKKYFDQDKFEDDRNILNFFIKNHPNNIYCGMMHYYIGQSYFFERNYEKAASSYMDSFNINSTGSKTPKALYQLAVCFQKLEKRKQMEQTLGKVIESFPGHEYAKKAEAMLEKIKKTR